MCGIAGEIRFDNVEADASAVGQQAIALIEAIYDAQFASISASRVKAMGETPIKAGCAGPGKLKAGLVRPEEAEA